MNFNSVWLVCLFTADGHKIFSILESNGTAPSYVLDGMTNDVNGNLYMATFGGSKIIEINPK